MKPAQLTQTQSTPQTIQTTLQQKTFVDIAIQRIREHEPPEGYNLAFSGGKDSIVCYDLCKRAGVRFHAHYSNTTIDPPDIPKFVRENYPDVEILKCTYKGKRTNYYALIAQKGLPTRFVRWCCACLKEVNSEKGSTVVLGVRREESVNRSKRDVYGKFNGVYHLNPIVDWTSEDVWGYIHSNHLKYPALYDNGYKRIGCVMCPLACRAGRIRDYNKYPNRVKAIETAVDKYLLTRPDCSLYKWGKNAHDIVHYWIFESPIESAKGACLQTSLNKGITND